MTRTAFLPLELVRAETYRGYEPVRPARIVHPETVAKWLPVDEDWADEETPLASEVMP